MDSQQKSGRPLVIAGAASGVGKTTVAVGIMGACRRRGLKVAPFKAGPDYIDTGFHQKVTGAPSRNLDTWLTSADEVRAVYVRGAAGADIAVVEGVMGLFDGRTGAGSQGSTAEVAGLIGGAVVLVADCSGQARSLAPLLHGFATFDPDVKLAGCILNNVGGASHARILAAAAVEAGVPVLGIMPRSRGLEIPSRHLGLVPAGERPLEQKLTRIIEHVQENVDIDALLSLAGAAAGPEAAGVPDHVAGGGNVSPAAPSGRRERVRLAIARDEAFSFYYVDSLEALEEAGAELVPFSPIRGEALPACDGLYLGGGFPEMFADKLEANGAMRQSVAAAVSAGLPTYAECGGLVYLCQSIEVDGVRRGMSGAIPLPARMESKRQALGYVEATARRDSILLKGGGAIRGHEFHWSAVDWSPRDVAYDCYSNRTGGGSPDGYNRDNVLASYVHIHFGGNREAASRFVAACAGFKRDDVRAGS